MFISFEALPSSARVWIFQSNRPLTSEELNVAEAHLRAFTEEWSVHGLPLNTSFKILYQRFIVLAADESSQPASGCSIDSSVRALKALEQELNIDLFDRSLVTFKQGDDIRVLRLDEIKREFAEGKLTGDTLTFNNLVDTREQFENGWLVPAAQTWLKRYLPRPLAQVE